MLKAKCMEKVNIYGPMEWEINTLENKYVGFEDKRHGKGE